MPRSASAVVLTIVLAASGRVLPAADCNGNGREDADDIGFALGDTRSYPLAELCLFWSAWPRDTPIVAGDLNGDGAPDLVTANCGTFEEPASTVSILLNNGDGSYGAETMVAAGLSPRWISLGDLNGDGLLDIVTANENSNDVSVLLNDGNAAFTAAPAVSIGGPVVVVPADLDGDGDADLAVSHRGGVTVFMNDGSAAFTQGATFGEQIGGRYVFVRDLTSADVDRDGDRDLIGSDNDVYVWLNPGDGAFSDEPALYDIGEGNHGICWTHAIAAVDLNGDDYPDIATADYTDGGTPSVSVFLNERDGTFGMVTPYYVTLSDENQCLTTGDFDKDGATDIACLVAHTLCVFFNNGDGTFSEAWLRPEDGYVSTLTAADVDGNGSVDIVVKEWGNEDDRRYVVVHENATVSGDGNDNGIPDECEPEQVLIERGDVWAYFRGTEAPPDSPDWRTPDVDDSTWDRGLTGIGYGDDDDETVLPDMHGTYVSIFCRTTFTIENPSAVTGLALEVDYDDGFIAYVNGFEAARSATMGEAGRPFAFDEPALETHEAGRFEFFDLTDAIPHLAAGVNVLAVAVHNTSIESSDLSFIPRLLCTAEPTPLPLLRVSSAEVTSGGSAAIFVRLTSAAPVQAYSFGIAHDPQVATLTGIGTGGCPVVQALNGGAGPAFFEADITAGTGNCTGETTAGGTAYLIASQQDPETQVIPPSLEEPIVHLTYQAAPSAAEGQQTPLTIVGCLGDNLPWDVVLTVNRRSVEPAVESGTLTVLDPVVAFRRGDTNEDGRTDISDVVTILGNLFDPAAPAVHCTDAADTNDDGTVDIADAITLLQHLFGNGDPLPAPFGECGPDSTEDSLECEEYTSC